MIRFTGILLPIAILISCVLAQQPPVLDRELFFGDPEISGAQISPDGQYIAFIKPWKGTRNIWVKKTDEPFDKARVITADTTRPIPAYFWSRDGKYILFVQDKAGDENYNVYAVNPADPPAAGSEVPAARNITEAKSVRAIIYAVPRSDPDIVYVGLNDRDKAWHDLYRVRISTGERTLIRENKDRIVGWVFDVKDQLKLAFRINEKGDNEILRVDPDGLMTIYSCGVFETCSPVRYHEDNKQVYIQTNKGDDVDLVGLALLDPKFGKVKMVESDPLKRVDLEDVFISDLTDKLVATTYLDDKKRIYWKDKSYESDYSRIKKQLGDVEISINSQTKDERLWLISASSDTEPGRTYLFDRKTKKLTEQYRIRERLPREDLASMKPVRYPSSDGLEINAYLTLPKGIEAKNLPAVIIPHGGPWARDTWGYDGFAQFIANRGYAVLQPNFRGSTGYGKKFLNAGNLQWGEKMQDDITWGVKYLVAQGISDPKRIGIMGGSYGGYATLAGVAFTPDVYAAAVAVVAPSNLITLLESIPPYWEPIRVLFYKRMGDPNTPEGKAQLQRQSPLNSAVKIKTPLMVAQGANDPRVNKRESDQIVIALRDRGFPVEYLVAPDEGHGFARPVNNMAMFAAAEKFLAKHLGGRYQEGGTAEVMTRLTEITVDPKTVGLPEKIDPAKVGLPQVSAGLPVGVYKYAAKIQMGPQSMNLAITTAIREGDAGWAIDDVVTTPAGDVTTKALLEKATLAVLKQSLKQGPFATELNFEGNRLRGMITANGQQTPLELDLGGRIFADGAGAAFSMGALPLAEGYSVIFRNFDAMKRQVRLMEVKVTGSESVTVPAGTFDTYRLEVAPVEGSGDKASIWIAKDSRKPVKTSNVLSQMGGAVMTLELQ